MPNIYAFALLNTERKALKDLLSADKFLPLDVQHADVAVDAPSWKCHVTLYTSGKCVVQGRGARDFMENMMEPLVLKRTILNQDGFIPGSVAANTAEPLSREALSKHVGVDESGKGDFFGPLVVAGVFVDSELALQLKNAGAKDSKLIQSDKTALATAAKIRRILGPKRYTLVRIGCHAYNKMYARVKSLNRILAWAHAKCIDNLAAGGNGFSMAISDQFGSETAVATALRKLGRTNVKILSRTKAESDIAVAAASLIAREEFLLSISDMGKMSGIELPKGASRKCIEAGIRLVNEKGIEALLKVCKCHFSTLDSILAETNLQRADLPPECSVTSSSSKLYNSKKPPSNYRRVPSDR